MESRGIDGTNIIVFGRSLGGSVASWLACEVTPRLVVIESSFTSAPDMASEMFPYLPTRICTRFKYDSLSRINQVRCPVMIAHSPQDSMIPFEHSQKLFEKAKEPKAFVETTGNHNDGGLDSDTAYQLKFKEFLAQHPPTPQTPPAAK